jgi:hypothetical protein
MKCPFYTKAPLHIPRPILCHAPFAAMRSVVDSQITERKNFDTHIDTKMQALLFNLYVP